MKRIYDNLLLLLLCLSGLCSCDDVMDTHKAFIQGGEIIYAPMPDTIFFVAGKNRVELNYEISKAPNVKFMNVYWDNGAGSLVVPLELSSGTEKGKVILDDMEEKSYTFTVELQDSYGHKSLKTTGIGSSYEKHIRLACLKGVLVGWQQVIMEGLLSGILLRKI